MRELKLTYIFTNLCLFLLVILPGQNVLGNETDPGYEIDFEVFEIPGHGELGISVPRLWNYNFTKVDESTPPLITFYVLDRNEAEIFQLNMSIFTDDGYSRNITHPDYIKSMVTMAGDNTLLYSDQDQLLLEEITGDQGAGYYFNLSDSSAGKGEYQYLTQGALSVGQVLLVFSLFSNDETGILRDAMLRSLQTARHNDRKDV